MRAGLLRNKIQILGKTVEKDAYGSEKETWSILNIVRADVRYKSGGKQVSDNEIFNSQSIEINIRYIPGLNETMRVSLNDRLYKIVFIDEPEYRRALRINVERISENA